MKAIAKHRYARSSAQKVRLVAQQVQGLPVERALAMLNFSTKKAAFLLKTVLQSAIANAENNLGAVADNWLVSCVFVDEAARIKRMRARAKGRGSSIFKRTCHINVVIVDKR